MFESSEEKQKKQDKWTFDVWAKLVVPSLALIAFIIAQLLEQASGLLWGLLGLVILSIIGGLSPTIKGRMNRWLGTARDRRVARKAYPEFKRFLRQFQEFTDTTWGRTDTFHGIINEMQHQEAKIVERLQLVPPDIFHNRSYYLGCRAEKQTPNLTNFVLLVQETNAAVNAYSYHCVMIVFERLPQDVRRQISENARSSLEDFRQRFVHFLDEYAKYLRNLDESFGERRNIVFSFPRPKPL